MGNRIKSLFEEFEETVSDQDITMTHIILAITIALEGFSMIIRTFIKYNSDGRLSTNNYIAINGVDVKRLKANNGLSKFRISKAEKSAKLSFNGKEDSLVHMEERERLMRMTNDELRFKLKGVKRISRLKKSELVELIISSSNKVKQGNFVKYKK